MVKFEPSKKQPNRFRVFVGGGAYVGDVMTFEHGGCRLFYRTDYPLGGDIEPMSRDFPALEADPSGLAAVEVFLQA